MGKGRWQEYRENRYLRGTLLALFVVFCMAVTVALALNV